MTLNSELIELVRRKLLLKEDLVKEVIYTYYEMLETSLIDGEEVKIPGFGRFKIMQVKERDYTDCRGDKYTVEAHRRLGFKPSKILRRKVWDIK